MFKRLLGVVVLFCALASPVLGQTTTKEMPQAWEASTPFAKHLTPAQLSAVQAGMSGNSCAAKVDLEPLFVQAETDVTMQSNTPYALGAAEIDLPPGCYWLNETWNVHRPLIVRGVTAPGGVGGSVILNWPANTAGIVANPAGSTGCQASAATGSASGLTLINLDLTATISSTIDPLGTENGVTACTGVTLQDVNIRYFAGDCLDVETGTLGVADFSKWIGGHCLGNGAHSRYCVYFHGSDSNANSVRDVLCTNVGGAGFADASGTGGSFSGGGVESSGSAPTLFLVNQSGASFECINPIPGQCKTTTPGTNSGIWAPIVFNAGYGAYSAATNYIASGPLNANVVGAHAIFTGLYIEGSDPPSAVEAPNMVVGGTIGSGSQLVGSGGGALVMGGTSALNIVGSFFTSLGGWAATDYINNGQTHELDVTLGGNGADCDVLGANNVSQGADVYRWHYANCGADLFEDNNAGSTTAGRIFTLPTTSFTGGRSATQTGFDVFPKGAFIGQTETGARWIGPCPGAAPVSGAWATGDICWNTSAANIGDVLWWINTSGGSPGTFKIGDYLGAQANLGTAQTWTAAQSFNSGDLVLKGSSSGSTTIQPAATASGVLTAPSVTDTLAVLGTAQHFTAAQQFDAVTNGKGIQAFNVTTTCTTAATVGAICTTGAESLPVAYADTNYRVSCTGLTPTAVPIVQTVTKSNSSFTITVAALTAVAAHFTSFDCIAAHN